MMTVIQNKQLAKKDLLNLIEGITPLNNRYRELVKGSCEGTKALGVMWQVGELLEEHLGKYLIKPHNLYWQIYGKAEGLKNTYITRDFLSYCLRIRRYFSNINDIPKQFPSLQRYSLFREAFPLLENPKYKLSQEEATRLKQFLNSNIMPCKIKEAILKMKSQKIGIKNTRRQRLQEMKVIADNFVVVYNEIYNIIKTNDNKLICEYEKMFSKELTSRLSQAVAALTQESLYVPEMSSKGKLPEHWKKFIDNLNMLFQSTVETRNRYRRLISPKKLFNFAEMLNALVTDRGIVNYRKRRSIE